MPDDFQTARSLAALRRHLLDPYPWFQQMRERQPVVHSPELNSWNLFRYDDVLRVLSDTTTFSSHVRRISPGSLFADSLIDSDPPRHAQLRSLVSQAFTPRSIEAFEPRVQALTQELLDRALPSGTFDVIRDLAYPLPVLVIGGLLGLAPADAPRLKRWSDLMMSLDIVASNRAHAEMTAYFETIVEERRREPSDDLVSRLIAARIGDEHLAPAELVDFCCLLLVTGHVTTTHAIGNAILCFIERPDLWERLRADPTRLPAAIEEVLRYRSPTPFMPRVAAVDATIGEHVIKAGTRLVPWIGSANRDETRFPQADQFDIDRAPNPHIAFGRGIHFCLGAPLARMETRIALNALLERAERLTRVPGVRLEPFPSQLVHGVRSLPVRVG